jgi:hypothetical protein
MGHPSMMAGAASHPLNPESFIGLSTEISKSYHPIVSCTALIIHIYITVNHPFIHEGLTVHIQGMMMMVLCGLCTGAGHGLRSLALPD